MENASDDEEERLENNEQSLVADHRVVANNLPRVGPSLSSAQGSVPSTQAAAPTFSSNSNNTTTIHHRYPAPAPDAVVHAKPDYLLEIAENNMSNLNELVNASQRGRGPASATRARPQEPSR